VEKTKWYVEALVVVVVFNGGSGGGCIVSLCLRLFQVSFCFLLLLHSSSSLSSLLSLLQNR